MVASAVERGVSVLEAKDFRALPGHGVQVLVDGHDIRLGGPALVRGLNLELPSVLKEAIDRAGRRGQTAITLLDGATPIAIFVADAVRDESREAIRRLHEQQIEVNMITGDAQAVANAVAEDLNIDTDRKMLQNLWWASGYNIFAIPLAAGVLAPWGIVLHPAIGAVLMSVSIVVVALNAQLLRRVKL